MQKKLFILIAFVAVFLCSCKDKDRTWEKNSSSKSEIAVITKSTDSNFWKAVERGVNTAATEYNLNVTFEGPESEEDYQKQNQMIQDAIKNKVSAIVISVIDAQASASILHHAKEEGIAVIIIDSGGDIEGIDAEISTDNERAGEKVAEAMLKSSEGEITVGIINFDKNTTNGQERENGFRTRMKRESRVTIAGTNNVESNVDSAKAGCKKLLQEYPKINAIATFNEWTTLGVGEAIQELDLKDCVSVIAFDNNVVSVGMLESGEIDGLLVQNPFAMGYLAIENSYRLIKGKQKEGTIIYTDTIFVDRGNMFDASVQKILFPLDYKN